MIVVLFFAVFSLFFTVNLVSMADQLAVNEFNPIEGTDQVSVIYSNLRPNGLYVGDRVNGKLKLKGYFGFDWGAYAEGSTLYINEYTNTELGMMLCKLVRVDLDTFEKEVVFSDAILRGRCASGELVVIRGFLMPSCRPATNALCKLYSFVSDSIELDGDRATVLFLDPATGEVVYSVKDPNALSDGFEARYIDRTLEEVMG